MHYIFNLYLAGKVLMIDFEINGNKSAIGPRNAYFVCVCQQVCRKGDMA